MGFIEAIENLDYVETIKFLAERVNINVDSSSFSEKERQIYEQKQRIYKKAARNKVQHKILKQLETETEKQYHF